ncbi:MAG TPA: ATP-binding protein [Stellaceae bacterium]|nr:ATP-binding protein [Stellaceae bacterium]
MALRWRWIRRRRAPADGSSAARRPRSRFALVVAIFAGTQAIMLTLGLVAIEGLHSTRAYVAGEGAYSKAQKDAVLNLYRYVRSGDAQCIEEFRRAIAVPIGDRLAREALERTPADLADTYAGFAQGRNEARDIRAMARVFHWFSWWGPFARAVDDWRNADRLVTDLASLGEDVFRTMASGPVEATERDRLLLRVDALDAQLTDLENSFSRHMGEAARALRTFLITGFIVGSIVLWAIGIRLCWRVFRDGELAGRRLAESEERFRDYAQAASDWFWETDQNGRLVYLSGRHNAPAPDGDPRLGKTVIEAAGGDPDDPAWRAHLDDLAAQRPFRNFSFRRVLADGSIRYFAVSGTPVYDALGRFSGYRGTGRDITAETEVHRNLQQAKEVAETASRTKSEFLANMSHELRTPLNAILGFAEIIRDKLLGPIGDHRYSDYAEDIHSSGTHLLRIINDILDLSKVEAGRLELVEDVVEMEEILKAVSLLLRERLTRAGLGFEITVPPGPCLVRADERKLKQILMNLLSNAVKFTPAGGEISLRLERSEDGIVIEVRDSGIGIAAEDIARAMSPFGQVDSRLSRRYEGTGLGLPLAKALTELHGGKLELESEPGVGTVARVRLPRERLIQPDVTRWAAG